LITHSQESFSQVRQPWLKKSFGYNHIMHLVRNLLHHLLEHFPSFKPYASLGGVFLSYGAYFIAEKLFLLVWHLLQSFSPMTILPGFVHDYT
jgi:hypothetical protein